MKKKRIGRKKALSLMRKCKEKPFTAMFVKKDGCSRTIVAKYWPEQTRAKLGYVTVEDQVLLARDPSNCIRTINIQTLYELIVYGKHYKIS